MTTTPTLEQAIAAHGQACADTRKPTSRAARLAYGALVVAIEHGGPSAPFVADQAADDASVALLKLHVRDDLSALLDREILGMAV